MPQLTERLPISDHRAPNNINVPATGKIFFHRIAGNDFLLGLYLPLSILLLWQAAVINSWIPPQILPSPRVVAGTLAELVADGTLFEHTVISLWRVISGVAIGGFAGLILGFTMGLSRHASDIIGPTFRALALVPKLGWIPLLILLVGIDEALKVVSIAIGAAVPVALNTLQGVRNIPTRYQETAKVLGIYGLNYFRKIIFPSTLPGIITGFTLAFSFGWKALIAVELMASSEGLGFLMTWGRQLFQLDIVMSTVIVIGVIGFLLDRFLLLLSNRLLYWLK